MADDEPAADNAAEPPADAAAEDVADADDGINNADERTDADGIDDADDTTEPKTVDDYRRKMIADGSVYISNCR